ncbi:hypothetical protein PQQ87_24130 [Paraburkholderia nemoris]|uniref:hypothetical protein n=1 Tax=Paraburkholderia nemoris TaxID=2793076 RepID=UPI0038BD6142
MAIRQRYWETKPGTYPEDPPREALTTAGVEYLLKHQSPPPRDDVRADSFGDGLRMVERINDAGGKVRVFENTGSRKVWLDRFRCPLQEQVFLNTKALGADDRKVLQDKILADREARNQVARDLAAGRDVAFDYDRGVRVK